MDRFTEIDPMLPQKAVDDFKALMGAEYRVRLSEDEAREQADHFLTVMKHALCATKPTSSDSQGCMSTVADSLERREQPRRCDPTKIPRKIEGLCMTSGES